MTEPPDEDVRILTVEQYVTRQAIEHAAFDIKAYVERQCLDALLARTNGPIQTTWTYEQWVPTDGEEHLHESHYVVPLTEDDVTWDVAVCHGRALSHSGLDRDNPTD